MVISRDSNLIRERERAPSKLVRGNVFDEAVNERMISAGVNDTMKGMSFIPRSSF